MSGGSGPIDTRCAESLGLSARDVALNEQSKEVEIFKNLSMNRVVYFPKRQCVYFAESQYSNVRSIIKSVFDGLRHKPNIEQLFMDKHKFFRGPLKINVNAVQARTLLVAFRLNGIVVTYPETKH